MQTIFVARQPIYDRKLARVGYELLYRSTGVDHARIVSERDASAQVIVNAFIDIGIDHLVGSAFAFINVPEALILNDALLPMFHEQTVLEIGSQVPPTEAVLSGLQHLRERGFSIALDRFRDTPDRRALLPLADYVKIDVTELGGAAVPAQLDAARAARVAAIAQRVEAPAQFAACRDLGFDFFQGYFFCRPQLLTGHSVKANKLVILHLLQRLADPDINLRDLEAALAGDVSIPYKLLRYANSAAFGQRREIESLRDAIVLVGIATIRNWASLILLDSVSRDKPPELIRTAMARAAMCERLGRRLEPPMRPQAFLVGLFSVLDAILDTPMERLLDDIALSAPIKFALLAREGALGQILRQVERYEAGEWGELLQEGADMEHLQGAYDQALRWADENAEMLFG
jgi:c-di-GMP phosphodiesterase